MACVAYSYFVGLFFSPPKVDVDFIGFHAYFRREEDLDKNGSGGFLAFVVDCVERGCVISKLFIGMYSLKLVHRVAPITEIPPLVQNLPTNDYCRCCEGNPKRRLARPGLGVNMCYCRTAQTQERRGSVQPAAGHAGAFVHRLYVDSAKDQLLHCRHTVNPSCCTPVKWDIRSKGMDKSCYTRYVRCRH